MLVKEVMKPAISVEKDISLSEAARIMSDKRIGSLIYVSSGKIAGIITERDMLKQFGKKEKISKVASRRVISIKSSSNVNEALEIMRENQIKRLPVVEKERLVGIITLTDIAACINDLEGDFFF